MTTEYKYLFTYWSSYGLWACCEWVDGRWVGMGMNDTLKRWIADIRKKHWGSSIKDTDVFLQRGVQCGI